MARKKRTGAAKPEAGKEQKPTVEAAGSEEVQETEAEVEVSEEEVAPEEEVAKEEKDAPKPAAKKEKVFPAGKGPNKPKKRMFKIMIADQDGPDNSDVFATDPSDGKPFLIMRGQEVTVPVGVVNNLKESIQGKLSYDNEGNEVWKDVNRFAMTILGEVK